MKFEQHQWLDLAALLCTILLFYLGFPSGGFGYFAWFALVPIFSRLTQPHITPIYAAKLILLAATLGWMVSIWWVVIGLSAISLSAVNITILLVFAFCVLAAIPYAIAGYLHVKFDCQKGVVGALKSSVIFTVLVCYTPHVLPGNIAHSLYLRPQEIQLAGIGGVALVFFVIHFVNLLIVNGLSSKSKLQKYRCFGLALIIYGLNVLFGLLQIQQNAPETPANNVQVMLVQPNYSVKLRTREDWQQHKQVIADLIESNLQQGDKPELIVLPEIPMPISVVEFEEDRQWFQQISHGIPIVIAGIEFTENNQYYNVLELLQLNGEVQIYKKQVLLPFGEYLPFEQQFPWLRKIMPNTPTYIAGEQQQQFHLRQNKKRINISPLICYEAVFSSLVGANLTVKTDFILNAVDDAWFGNTAGANVHFALALFRTIEYGIPLVRVTNNGISAVVNHNGQVLADSLPPMQASAKQIQLRLQKKNRFYAHHPNDVAYLIFGCLVLILLIELLKVNDNKNKQLALHQ